MWRPKLNLLGKFAKSSRTNEFAKLLRNTFLITVSSLFKYAYFFSEWVVCNMLPGCTVTKVCASPRNLTWFTIPFLLVRGLGLGTRLKCVPHYRITHVMRYLSGLEGYISQWFSYHESHLMQSCSQNTQVAVLAVSLGGVETLVEHPASMTHNDRCVPPEMKNASGITDGLLRLRFYDYSTLISLV